jgi:hypothetical protein
MRITVFAALFLLAVSAEAASPISQVLPCGTVGVAGGLGGGTDLQRVTVDTKRFPEAICNDGTPAVFYIARYTTEADRNKWVIFLQGGGSCNDGQSCAERWCSIDTNYGMDKMSTTPSKLSIRGNGIVDPRPENHFGSWNRVLIYYCSSDLWSGTKTSTQHASSGSAAVDYVINFKGARIIDAVMDTLRRTSRGRAVAPPGTSAHAFPDLDNATHVLFAGSSAGGAGVGSNADRIAIKLRATNPSLVFKALIDAAFPPKAETKDYAHSVNCASNPLACSYTSLMPQVYSLVDQGLYGAMIDASCLAWHTAHEPGTEWRCADATHSMVHHITTPMFIHQDEQDSNIGASYVEDGFGTAADFGTHVEQQLRDLATLNTTAEEGSVRNGGAPLATPGAYGPQCTDHESLSDDAAFFDVKIAGFSYYDIVWNWWSGTQPQVAIRAFTPPSGAVAGCPQQ